MKTESELKDNSITPSINWSDVINSRECKALLQYPMDRVMELTNRSAHKIFPPLPQIFRAFDLTSPEKLKVVIVGQDPYHGPGQANGLAFAVGEGTKTPPSLSNIFKEMMLDLDHNRKPQPNLVSWAEQGVLLLNSILTVEQGKPLSHKDFGWNTFTDYILSWIDARCKPCVFMLWGNSARSKKSLITNKQHLVLEAMHPSPLSAHRGFFGCRHFSQANKFLLASDRDPINWV